jgi:hypothetical protein
MDEGRLKVRHCVQTRFEDSLILTPVRFSDDKLFGNRLAAFEFSIENLIVEEICGNETCKQTRIWSGLYAILRKLESICEGESQ